MAHLSMIIPVHNEAAHLPSVLPRILAAECQIPREWIIVDDRSTDGSTEILQQWIAEHGQKEAGMKLLIRPQSAPGGKGIAITEGFAAATGDYIVVQDADAEYDPNDIPRLLEPLLEDKADVVYGSRFRPNAIQVHRTFHYLVNRVLTALSNLASGIYLTDMETCYKLFRADLVKSMDLRSHRFGIEIELTANIAKVRARVVELPISYFPRTKLAGKKINWRDGVAALWHMVNYNQLTSVEKAFKELPERYRA